MPDPYFILKHRAAICWVSAATLIGFLVFSQLGMMLCLLAGHFGIAWVAPMALVLAVIVSDRFAVPMNLPGRARLAAAGLALAIMVLSLALSAYYFDLSYDGQWYDQPAVLLIGRDWNPLTEPMRHNLIAWTAYFPKGPWYVAAALYQTTGLIEVGKCVTWITSAAMGLAVFAAGLDWGLRQRQAVAVALVVALHPVAVSEMTTYMVDGIMVATLIVAAAAMFSGFRRPQAVVTWVGVLASIFCINIKLNGLAFLCFLFAGGGLWCVLRRRDWLLRYSGLVLLALVLGVGVFGYNPYVTNTTHGFNPLYPALGTTRLQQLNDKYETPKNMIPCNRLVRLGYAIFGRPGNAPYAGQKDAQLMWPFTATPSDLAVYRFQETPRVAGFGPFFSGALLIGFGLMAWLMLQSGILRLGPALSVVTIIGALLLSPLEWWPRMGPQLWLLPIIPAVSIFLGARSRWATIAAWLLLALLTVNAGIVAAVGISWETKASQRLRQQLTELHRSGQTIEVNSANFRAATEERLKGWGVPYQVTDPKAIIPNSTELMSVVDGYHGAVRYRVLPPGVGNSAN